MYDVRARRGRRRGPGVHVRAIEVVSHGARSRSSDRRTCSYYARASVDANGNGVGLRTLVMETEKEIDRY